MSGKEPLPCHRSPSPRRLGLSALRHRDFALLFSGTIVSHSGDLLQSMAQSWLVFQLTGSAAKLGLTGFCQLVPRLVLGAVGGVFVDRFDRRRLLLVTQTAAMLQSILFWALVVTHRITFGEILGLTLVLGVADTLNLTARHALIPALVPPAELQAGVALNAAGMNLTQVIGPSLGGVLLGIVGVSGCLALNAVSFLGILGALFAMRWRPRAGDRIRRPVRDELAEGIALRPRARGVVGADPHRLRRRRARDGLLAPPAGLRHRRPTRRRPRVRLAPGRARRRRAVRFARRRGARPPPGRAPPALPRRRHAGHRVVRLCAVRR